MSTATTLFLTLGGISFIAALLYYYVYRLNKEDKINLPLILENLEKSIQYRDDISTDKYGKDLIYNKYVTNKLLVKLNNDLDQTFGDRKSLEELRLLIYNKQLNWGVLKR